MGKGKGKMGSKSIRANDVFKHSAFKDCGPDAILDMARDIIWPIVPTKDILVLRRSTRVSNSLRGMDLVDFEETYSLVAIAKSIQIMFAITAWYDYEIWQMDMKMAFLNEFVEEEIYMDQSEVFTSVGEEQKVCHLQRSIMVSNKLPGAGISVLMRSYEL
ncbi:UNVERIFIED_CONTAM: hypothetical protein Scaly_3108500 [Sesamum calycinum]|uniref:Reverse transcriptase Ty1/copia-type domain-containing protein n=1 Tax=Sesamum calycinum TaxID=2727403 RepID=A0AAW2JKY0_9LAMI